MTVDDAKHSGEMVLAWWEEDDFPEECYYSDEGTWLSWIGPSIVPSKQDPIAVAPIPPFPKGEMPIKQEIHEVMKPFEHPGVWCCSEMAECSCLFTGLGWGLVETDPAWVARHNRGCGGRLIQLLPPANEPKPDPALVHGCPCCGLPVGPGPNDTKIA